jgi:glucose/arabinose dehydrogenase
MRRRAGACAYAASSTFGLISTDIAFAGGAAGTPGCDPDNGGLKLPPGFCAAVVADNVGKGRHLVVAPNGDLFVSLETGRGGTGGGVVALRDTDGDGKMDKREHFGRGSATGVALRNGYVYFATPNSIIRYKLPPGELMPSGSPETVADGLPGARQHQDKGLAFDGRGGVYVNVGAPSNACQQPDRQPKVPGQDPCPLLEQNGGIWRFDENKLGQKQADGKRYATGLRQMVGLTWHDNSLWAVMHNRDGLDTLWPGQFTPEQNAEWPAEYLLKVSDGANFGWPYCFYNNAEGKLVTNPEYGGDGKKNDRCAAFTPPTVAFPGHWAPNDVTFYTGTQFPRSYQGGAFVAFGISVGSLIRLHLFQDIGYLLVIQLVDDHITHVRFKLVNGVAGSLGIHGIQHCADVLDRDALDDIGQIGRVQHVAPVHVERLEQRGSEAAGRSKTGPGGNVGQRRDLDLRRIEVEEPQRLADDGMVHVIDAIDLFELGVLEVDPFLEGTRDGHEHVLVDRGKLLQVPGHQGLQSGAVGLAQAVREYAIVGLVPVFARGEREEGGRLAFIRAEKAVERLRCASRQVRGHLRPDGGKREQRREQNCGRCGGGGLHARGILHYLRDA